MEEAAQRERRHSCVLRSHLPYFLPQPPPPPLGPSSPCAEEGAEAQAGEAGEVICTRSRSISRGACCAKSFFSHV